MKPEPMIAVEGLSEGFDIAIDSERLAGNIDAGIGQKKRHHAGNVIRAHHASERHALEVSLLHLLGADADLPGAVGDHPVDAGSLDDAGKNGIDADAMGPASTG